MRRRATLDPFRVNLFAARRYYTGGGQGVQLAAGREIAWREGTIGDAEAELIARIAAADRDALAELYTRHQRPLMGYLMTFTQDHGLAEEVLQDTLLAVWRGAPSFERRSSGRTWLFGIARRQALGQLRRRRLPLAGPNEIETAPADSPSPEDTALANIAGEELEQQIASLAAVHREVLMLTFGAELSYSELAGVLGVPLGTVKSRLSNAKRALRARLEGAHATREAER